MGSTDTLLEALHALEPEVREKCVVNLNSDGAFSNVLKGCFIKCFEFAVLTRTLEPGGGSFFLAPALRGICEDFVALSYLRKNPANRDQLLSDRAMFLVFEGVEKQKAFFNARRAFQPVFSGAPKTTLPKPKLPTVKDMASGAGLADLYEFMYAVTSDVVHFNPRVILRNAWGKTKERFEHSTHNFDVYYADFCQTYALFLLCEYTRTFTADLALSNEFLGNLANIEGFLKNKLRWPEAVTFEEMNVEGPHEVIRVLLKSGQAERDAAQLPDNGRKSE